MLNLKKLLSQIILALTDWQIFLTKRNCSSNLKKGLTLTPALKGSGRTDISINHDKVLVVQSSEESLCDAVTAILANQLKVPVWTYDYHFDVMQAQVWR